MTKVTIDVLVTLIIAVCNVNKNNIDKKNECIDKLNNCFVDKDGNIYLDKVTKCINQYKDGKL
jgi:hypothetical protein